MAEFYLEPKVLETLDSELPSRVDKLRRIMQEHVASIGDHHHHQLEMPVDREIEWFLLDRKLDVDAAALKLKEVCAWRASTRGVSAEAVEVQRSLQKAYIHNHVDAAGRKVLVIRAARHFKPRSHEEVLAAQRVMQTLIDDAVAELEAQNHKSSRGESDENSVQSECVLGIMDLRGFRLPNADPKLANFLVDCFFKYYPKRMNEMLLVDAPFVFRPTWLIVKPVLGKYSSIVRFISADKVGSYFPSGTPLPPDFHN